MGDPVDWTAAPPSVQTDDYVQFDLAHTTMQIRANQAEQMLMFNITVPNQNYFAIGFGLTMIDTDMILWQANGDNSLTTDLWSTYRGVTPTPDERQSVVSSFYFNETANTVSFNTSRPMETGD